jgi:hypothetical protein
VHNELALLAFPELPDEAVIALNNFLEDLYTCFQNHYFAQIHRYYHDRPVPPVPDRYGKQLLLPFDDPPF